MLWKSQVLQVFHFAASGSKCVMNCTKYTSAARVFRRLHVTEAATPWAELKVMDKS
jgi:hypothetical protein